MSDSFLTGMFESGKTLHVIYVQVGKSERMKRLGSTLRQT
jgi:hypothetical protein